MSKPKTKNSTLYSHAIQQRVYNVNALLTGLVQI